MWTELRLRCTRHTCVRYTRLGARRQQAHLRLAPALHAPGLGPRVCCVLARGQRGSQKFRVTQRGRRSQQGAGVASPSAAAAAVHNPGQCLAASYVIHMEAYEYLGTIGEGYVSMCTACRTADWLTASPAILCAK